MKEDQSARVGGCRAGEACSRRHGHMQAQRRALHSPSRKEQAHAAAHGFAPLWQWLHGQDQFAR
jgi:hypothetical protein